MTYRHFAPDPILQQDIRCLWTLDETQAEFNRDAIIPDTYVELIFNYGAPLRLLHEDGSAITLPRVFLNGLQNGPLQFHALGHVQFVAVRFYAWAIQPLLVSQPNSVIPLSGRWDDLADSLAATIQSRGEVEAVASLQQMMVDAYQHVHPDTLPVVRTAGKLLYASSGLIRMEEVADRSYLSLRQLERRFKELTGITPKSFARLVRYETVRNRLYIDPAQPLLDLAHEYGYTDQAHLTHDFKSYTALTPGEFAAFVQTTYYPTKKVEFLQDR